MSGSSVCQPEGSEFEFYLRSHFLFTTKSSTFWLTERRRVLAEMANTRGMSHSHEAGRHRADQPTAAWLCPFDVNLSLSRPRRARLVNWLWRSSWPCAASDRRWGECLGGFGGEAGFEL